MTLEISKRRQYRGLLLAWRNRPEWLREEPGYRVFRRKVRSPHFMPGMDEEYVETRYSKYRRIALPTFGQLRGKNARNALEGRCRWCRQPVADPNRSLWHQDCVPAYWAATGQQSNLMNYLRAEWRSEHNGMGIACDECGTLETEYWNFVSDRFPDHDAYLWVAGKLRQPFEVQARQTGHRDMELDHRDALSVAWASGSESRLLRALTIDNLRWLCHDCHSVKTGLDKRRMNNLMNGREEDWMPEDRMKTRPLEPANQGALFDLTTTEGIDC